jgi:hypothetical protein
MIKSESKTEMLKNVRFESFVESVRFTRKNVENLVPLSLVLRKKVP